MADEDDELEKDLKEDNDKTVTSDDDFPDRSKPDDDTELSELEKRDESLDDPFRRPKMDDDDLEKEVDDADAVSQKDFDDAIPDEDIAPKKSAESELKGEQPTDEQLLTPMQKYRQMLDQYAQLQHKRQQSDLVSGLMTAGAQAGQAMAGRYSGHFKPDLTGAQMVQAQGARPVTDFEQGQIVQGRGVDLKSKLNASDPNSPQSKLVRSYLNDRIFNPDGKHPQNNLPDTVSASDAMMLMKSIGRPLQSRYQRVNGTWTNPDTGETTSMSADFNPATGQYEDPATHQPLPGFHAESLNPNQVVRDPTTGNLRNFNKSTGGLGANLTNQAPIGQQTNPQDVFNALPPAARTTLNKEVKPEFNKENIKLIQRLQHVPAIMQRLQDAQTNPAAYSALKAEITRFEVGDQRLAQSEFDMFGKRYGYSGWGDWLNAKTTGTISSDFAQDMGNAIQNLGQDLQQQLSASAETKAQEFAKQLPKGQQVDPKLIAPLLYGGYKPTTNQTLQIPNDRVHVISPNGQEGHIPKSQVEAAKKQGYKVINDGR